MTSDPQSRVVARSLERVRAVRKLEPVPPDQQAYGRYTLLCRLASGGMANLYLACYIGPDGFEKLVAIKRIHEHLADDTDFLTMFVDEARLAARIAHPNVAQVLDLGSVGHSFYIAMEYVAGESLAELIMASAPPVSISARIVSEAARGLHAAHGLTDNRGNLLHVVHRDVSPQNVLVSYDGAVKVVDFGVAKARSNSSLTQAGMVKGKFSYMAPEQLRPDQFGTVDHRADVFPLGILLYEATTRKRLFKGVDKSDSIEQVLCKEVIPPTVFMDGYPDELAQICLRALERRPDDRYQSAEDLHLALEAYLGHSGVTVLPGHIADMMGQVFRKRKAEKEGIVRACLASLPATESSLSVLSRAEKVVPAGGRWTGWSLALLIATGVMGVIALLLFVYSALRPAAEDPVPPRAAAPPARIAGTGAKPRSEKDAGPVLVTVHIAVSPYSAKIVFDGEPVDNPYIVHRPSEPRSVNVTVSAPEHEPADFEVSLMEGGRWTLALERRLPPRRRTERSRRRRRRGRRKRPPVSKKPVKSLFANPYER